MGCEECGWPQGLNPKQAIFAVGLSGHYSAHMLCSACWKSAHEHGGPGPNVRAKAQQNAAVVAGTRRMVRGY